MELLKVSENEEHSYLKKSPLYKKTYVDLVVIKAVLQVLQEWIFRQGFEEDHVAHPDHVV